MKVSVEVFASEAEARALDEAGFKVFEGVNTDEVLVVMSR
jgi:hypothetical protein